MKRCLVVDDSDVIRRIARLVLERMGWVVSEAASGSEAVDRCAADAPDLMLLDWHMPGASGHEVLGRLRTAGLAKRPYTVYCTTANDADDIARAIALGASDFVIKPFTREMLQEILAAMPACHAA